MLRFAPLFLIFQFLTITLFAQKKQKNTTSAYEEWMQRRTAIEFPTKDGIVTFEQIDSITVQGKNKGDLVTSFKSALSDVLKQAKSAIDIDDRQGGLVIAKIFDSYYFTYKKKVYYRPLKYTIKFQSKDNRFRIQITNIEIGVETTVFNLYTIDTETIYNAIESREELISTLKNYKSMTADGKERSIMIKQGLKQHLEKVLNGLVLLTIKKANDDF